VALDQADDWIIAPYLKFGPKAHEASDHGIEGEGDNVRHGNVASTICGLRTNLRAYEQLGCCGCLLPEADRSRHLVAAIRIAIAGRFAELRASASVDRLF